MNKTLLILTILFLTQNIQAELAANYNIALEENGNAMVVLVIRGIGTINIPLPLDVKSPAVRGALYIQSSNGVDVSIDAEGTSTIVYKTALLTNRNGRDWDYMMEIPQFNSASIILTIPENTKIEATNPNAAITHVGETKNIIWNINPKNETSISARFQYTEKKNNINNTNENPKTTIIKSIILAATILFLLLSLHIIKNPRKNLIYTPGKQNVLKTLSGNETKIINILLQNPEGIQRNKLEKESQIPKSSLASSLQNLEKKIIITVDRSYNVHFIEMTEWFKKL